jgi:hypothetical protein
MKGVESYSISNTDFMELYFQDEVDRTGSGPSSMAGFDIKGVEPSDSGTDVVVCWLKLSIFDA